jgi:tetratricopeptide (TPR) repeat protein
VIARRLDRLSQEARDLSRVAAVAGEQFSLELGAEVLKANPFELSRTCEELETAQLWRGLRFSHDLVFETVFESIPETTRTILHGSVLDALEGSNVAAAVMASHAVAAGRLEATVRYSLKAGFEAFQLSALTQTVKHLELVRGIIHQPLSGFDVQAVVNDSERLQMYRTLQECYGVNGLHQPLLEQQVFDEICSFEIQTRDEAVKTQIQFLQKARQYDETGNNDALRNLLKTKLNQTKNSQDLLGELQALKDLAHFEWETGQFIAAKAIYAQALSIARQLENNHEIGVCLNEIALQNSTIGHWNQAESAFIQASKHIDPRDRFALTRLRWLQAMNWFAFGQAHQSVAVLNDCLESWRTLEDHMRGAITRVYLSLGWLEQGEYGLALEFANDAERLAAELPLMQAVLFIPMMSVRLHLGQLRAAQTLLENARTFSGQQDRLMMHQIAEFSCALSAIQGNWGKAFPHALTAFKVRQDFGFEGFRLAFLRPRWLEIEALLRGGREDLARESLNSLGKSVGTYQRLRLTHLRSLAVLEAWEGNLESATAHLLEARALISKIGLSNERWMLEAKLAKLYEQNNHLEKASEARDTALGIVNILAAQIPDLETRNTFLGFAQKQITLVSTH